MNGKNRWQAEPTVLASKQVLHSCVLAIAMLSAGGCATGGCSCPPLIDYTISEQYALANEIDSATKNATWPRFIADYIQLREMTRVCAE